MNGMGKEKEIMEFIGGREEEMMVIEGNKVRLGEYKI